MVRHLIWLIFFLASLPAWSQAVPYRAVLPVAVCSGLSPDSVPTFTEATCRTKGILPLDPQGRFVWVKAQVDITPQVLAAEVPLGLFVSAKAATWAYVNGELVGTNGVPSKALRGETPGKADAVFRLAPGLLRPGANDIVFAMSGHHSVLTLPAPVTVLLVGPYVRPGDFLLRQYLPSLPLLGILLLGSLYFSAQAIRSRGTEPSILLPAATLFATLQLLAEVSRAVIPFSYPYHDVRLGLIILFAAGFGACLLVHVVSRFEAGRRKILIPAGLGLMVVVISFTQSYDDKAAFAIMVPAILGALVTGAAALRAIPFARLYTALLTLASFGIYQTTSEFLDVYFYYLVALLLLFLFWVQLQTLAEAKAKQADEKARADRLQMALDHSRERDAPTGIGVKSAGSVEMVAADKLVFCKGARDYVDLMLNDGTSKLHSGSLTELEDALPATFLRVHRSYLVNTTYVDKLVRDTSGTGTLTLSTGDTVPVSRRIMPSVRKALV